MTVAILRRIEPSECRSWLTTSRSGIRVPQRPPSGRGREEPRPAAGHAHGASAHKAQAGRGRKKGGQPASRAEPKASTTKTTDRGGCSRRHVPTGSAQVKTRS